MSIRRFWPRATMGDQAIPCGECSAVFVFTEAEGAFFAARGLLPPKRCRTCRARRAEARPQRPGAAELPSRRRWAATCTGCGAGTSVPFEPSPGRDVFCKPCWDGRQRAICAPDINDPGIIE
jgi:CxxC-x17-CxxC domain-containing protein